MSENFTDFEFSPEFPWSFLEIPVSIDRQTQLLDAETVRGLVLRNVFGLELDDLGDALVGAKLRSPGSWIVCYADSCGNTFGTADQIFREEDHTGWLIIRMEDLG